MTYAAARHQGQSILESHLGCSHAVHPYIQSIISLVSLTWQGLRLDKAGIILASDMIKSIHLGNFTSAVYESMCYTTLLSLLKKKDEREPEEYDSPAICERLFTVVFSPCSYKSLTVNSILKEKWHCQLSLMHIMWLLHWEPIKRLLKPQKQSELCCKY